MRRLFIAVELSIAVVERLIMLQDEIADRVDDEFGDDVRLRLVEAPNIHITLKFLGDTSPAMVPMITERLQDFCEPLFPFQVECQQLGAFPSKDKPRILWAGLDDKGAEVLGLLQKTLEQELNQLGIEEERRPFHPHITLARVKSWFAPDFEELFERYDGVTFGENFIKEVVLYESFLDHRGPRYEVVKRFALGG